MRKVEAIETTGVATLAGSFIMARQIEMGEFHNLSGGLNTFLIIAAFSAGVAGLSEIIRRREARIENRDSRK